MRRLPPDRSPAARQVAATFAALDAQRAAALAALLELRGWLGEVEGLSDEAADARLATVAAFAGLALPPRTPHAALFDVADVVAAVDTF